MFLTVQQRSFDYLNIICTKFEQKQTNKNMKSVYSAKKKAGSTNTASLKILQY